MQLSDRISGSALIAVGAAAVFFGSRLPGVPGQQVGPSVFPMVVGTALALCGDGATSKGDFYEALNAAGVWNLPLVVLVVNNQYAISVPRHRQSAAQTLAQKAFAAGIAEGVVQLSGPHALDREQQRWRTACGRCRQGE